MINPSTFLSFNTLSVASTYLLDGASPRISTGLCVVACGGKTVSNLFIVSSSKPAIFKFFNSMKSEVRTPAPPPLVTIPILFPLAGFKNANALALTKSSFIVSALSIPYCLNTAL